MSRGSRRKELAVVTVAGGKTLEEPYVIRPTSETIIGHFFAKWIRRAGAISPMLVNASGPTSSAGSCARACSCAPPNSCGRKATPRIQRMKRRLKKYSRMLDVYADVAENVMAMPVIKGLKTKSEKFAGAVCTYGIEAMMQNGLALQAGTSHDLGQNFGKKPST